MKRNTLLWMLFVLALVALSYIVFKPAPLENGKISTTTTQFVGRSLLPTGSLPQRSVFRRSGRDAVFAFEFFRAGLKPLVSGIDDFRKRLEKTNGWKSSGLDKTFDTENWVDEFRKNSLEAAGTPLEKDVLRFLLDLNRLSVVAGPQTFPLKADLQIPAVHLEAMSAEGRMGPLKLEIMKRAAEVKPEVSPNGSRFEVEVLDDNRIKAKAFITEDCNCEVVAILTFRSNGLQLVLGDAATAENPAEIGDAGSGLTLAGLEQAILPDSLLLYYLNGAKIQSLLKAGGAILRQNVPESEEVVSALLQLSSNSFAQPGEILSTVSLEGGMNAKYCSFSPTPDPKSLYYQLWNEYEEQKGKRTGWMADKLFHERLIFGVAVSGELGSLLAKMTEQQYQSFAQVSSDQDDFEKAQKVMQIISEFLKTFQFQELGIAVHGPRMGPMPEGGFYATGSHLKDEVLLQKAEEWLKNFSEGLVADFGSKQQLQIERTEGKLGDPLLSITLLSNLRLVAAAEGGNLLFGMNELSLDGLRESLKGDAKNVLNLGVPADAVKYLDYFYGFRTGPLIEMARPYLFGSLGSLTQGQVQHSDIEEVLAILPKQYVGWQNSYRSEGGICAESVSKLQYDDVPK